MGRSGVIVVCAALGQLDRTLPEEKKRRSFTKLRAGVNRAIAPLETDHIDFIAGS
jgi:hypothetical protein